MRHEKIPPGLTDDKAPDPPGAAQRADLVRLITCGCTGPERLTLILHYYEGLSLAEVGQMLELPEAAVIEIHDRVLARVRKALAGRREEFTELGGANP